MKRAQINSRIAAALIDGVIVSFAAETLHSVFRVQSIQLGYAALGATAWLGMLLTVAYFATMEASPLGATIGKQVMRIRVTTVDGKQLGVTQAILRSIGRLIPLGWLLVFSENERALHDYLGNSKVIEA